MSKASKKSAPRWYRIVGAVWYFSCLVVALGLGSLGGWLAKSPVASAMVKQGVLRTPPEQVFRKDHVNLLVLGCDEDRYYGGSGRNMKAGQVLRKQARADLLLVCRFDFRTGEITGLSIPRDTVVDIDGYRPMKINAFHSIAKKGEQDALTTRAVQAVIPVEIDRVLTLDYDAFQRMVNAVGGVTVDVTRRMKYRDIRGGLNIDLQPGVQRLSGYDAMAYVRYRKGDSDFKRQERQKDFMVQMKNAVLQNPASLTLVLEEVRAFIGNSLTPEELATLAYFGRTVPSASIRLGQVPVRNASGTRLYVDQSKLPEVLAAHKMDGSEGRS